MQRDDNILLEKSLRTIQSAHPVFSVYSCQIIMYEKVSCILNNSGETEEQMLLVASPGVFLIRHRTFFFQNMLTTSIPFGSITCIEVEPSGVTITSSYGIDKKLFFNCLIQLKIAARIHSIRQTIFGNKDSPYELKISPNLTADFERQNFTYRPTSKIMDVFLSNVIQLKIPQVTKDQLEKVGLFLNNIQGTLEINKELMNFQYLSAIAASLSTDKDIFEIRIKDLVLADVLPFLISILQRTTSVVRLIFVHVSFEGSFSPFVNFIKSKSNFYGSEWIFDNCDLAKGNFSEFFGEFIRYQPPIKILTFNLCNFSIKSFDTFQQTLFFSKCFHSLEALWITDVTFPDELMIFLTQLFGSEWLLKDKKLHTLAVINCVVKLDDLFQKMMMFETGIVNANLSGNTFESPLGLDLAKALSPQMNLVFENCGYCDESLSSLFQALALHKGKILRLNCSNALVSENGWKLFSLIQPKIVLPTLTELVWDRNPIGQANVISFIAFLKNQPSLTELSISDCINSEDAAFVIHVLSDFIKSCRLSSFRIQSKSLKTQIGPLLIQILEPLLRRYNIKVLDISGQNVGDINLFKITEMMPLVMEEFRFEGNPITSCDMFLKIVESLLQKNLKEMTWPDFDINVSMARTALNRRADMMTRFEIVKRQFSQKYRNHPEIESADITLTTINRYRTMADQVENNTSHQIRKVSSVGCKDDGRVNGVFAVNDEETDKLLEECGLDVQKNDPMKAIVEKFNKEYGLDALTEIVKSRM